MRKCRCLFFYVLLFLAYNFALSADSAKEGDEPARLATVQSRREALAVLIADKERLQNGDEVALIPVINHITELNLQLRDWDSALTNATESLGLARQVAPSANGSLLVDSLTLLALVHLHRSDYKIALNPLNEALELSRNLHYRRSEARTLRHLGTAYFHLSKHELAEQSINQALQISRELQDKQSEGLTLKTQGEIYILLDKPDQAITSLKLAETIWRSLSDPIELATTLVDQNFVAVRQGQWQSALALLHEAQTLLTDKAAEPYLAGQIAMSLGEVHEAYGQLPIALNYFKESLAHYDGGAHDVSAAIDARNKVGRVMARLGDFAGARQTIEEALRLAQEKKIDLLIGLSHEDLGRVYLIAGSYEQARLEFLSALDYFKKTENQRPWARAQSYLGQTEYLLGNLTAANETYQRALSVFKDLADYTNEAALCFGIGKLALHQGKLEKAGEYLRRSIELTERLRENAASKDLRSSFLASVHDRYETYVEWLMASHAKQPDQRFDIRAFEASEFGRARALLDSLRNYQRELRQAPDPLLLDEEEKLQREEQRLVDARAQLLSEYNMEKAIADIDRQLTDVRSRYETLQARINSRAEFTDLLRPEPLSYERIQNQITNAETSLLEYSLGSGRSFAWVVTKDGLFWKELPDKQTIEKAAHELIDLLNNPPTDPAHESRLQAAIDEVSRMVLLPVSSNLQTSRLIIVADGILQYVPFQILSASANAQDPLIDKFDIVNAPSASTLAIARLQRKNRQPGNKLLIGFGDPVFSSASSSPAAGLSDTRSDGVIAPGQLPRLFYSKLELRAIRDLAGSDSEFYVEHTATRHNLLTVDLSNFQIVHLVTHGVLNDSQPELSGLVLSLVDAKQQPLDGFVGLADIYKLRAPVDLVVLSACESALGKEVRGEGLIGLTRGFMYAGASSVIASLWNVDDEASAALMKHFYTNMLQRGMPPAAALRAAQNEIRKQPLWHSPYYWAGFTIQGEYDQSITVKPVTPSRRYGVFIAGGVLVIFMAAVIYWYFRRRRRFDLR